MNLRMLALALLTAPALALAQTEPLPGKPPATTAAAPSAPSAAPPPGGQAVVTSPLAPPPTAMAR